MYTWLIPLLAYTGKYTEQSKHVWPMFVLRSAIFHTNWLIWGKTPAYVILEKKKVIFFLFFIIEIDASSESWINIISIDVWFGQYLKIWNLRVQKNPNIEKIDFKVVQMKFLAMHITN